MTILITTNVHCDYCHNWIHGTVWQKPGRQAVRRLAHDMGWIARRSGGGEPLLDICPECQERERERGKIK